MARQPQVTRTIQTTKVNVLCLNIKEQKPFEKEIVLPRVYKDDQHIMKKVREIVDNDDTKAVHIVNANVVETLYGMSEQKFIELADILPPRKVYDKDTTEPETDNTETNN